MVNKVILIGRTGKDPEVKNFDNGGAICNFSLVTSEKFTDKSGEKKEITEWHNIVISGKLAAIAGGMVKKGDLVYIEGKKKTRSWEDNAGVKHQLCEIVIGFDGEFKLLGSKGNNENKPSESRPPVAPPEPYQRRPDTSNFTPPDTDPNDDLPF